MALLLPTGRGCRSAVDEGSNGFAPGVCNALRFCEMVSSTAVRDVRRKSVPSKLCMSVSWEGGDVKRESLTS